MELLRLYSVHIFLILTIHRMFITGQFVPTDLSFQTDLDPVFKLYWDFNDTHITFEMHVTTLGYVGFGISRTGKMAPADVAIGWVDDGQVYFGDYHTTGNTAPIMDISQDWTLVRGYEYNNQTILRIQRPIDTCDVEDISIPEGTVRLIYSYHPVDPVLPETPVMTEYLHWHGAIGRGTKTMLLIGNSRPSESETQHPAARSLDFLQNNFQLRPNETTTQACTAFYLPRLGGKQHVIKFEGIISAENEGYVHHMFLHRCSVPRSLYPRRFHGYTFRCYEDTNMFLRFCRQTIAGWTAKAAPFFFPEYVAVSIGGGDDPDFYVLESHVQNFYSVPDIIINSGIRLTYTTQLRPHDAGIMVLGTDVDQSQFIPPGETNFLSSSFCSERCLEWGFRNEETIQVFGLLLLTHSIGKSVRVRHFRNNTELPWIVNDVYYDSSFQPYSLLKKEYVIQKGDTLKVECLYNSSQRSLPTTGGYGSFNEMCQVHLLYYPKISLDRCLGWSVYDELMNERGERVPPQLYLQFLNAVQWTNNEAMRNNLRTALETSTEQNLCYSANSYPNFALDHFDRPVILQEYITPSSCG